MVQPFRLWTRLTILQCACTSPLTNRQEVTHRGCIYSIILAGVVYTSGFPIHGYGFAYLFAILRVFVRDKSNGGRVTCFLRTCTGCEVEPRINGGFGFVDACT